MIFQIKTGNILVMNCNIHASDSNLLLLFFFQNSIDSKLKQALDWLADSNALPGSSGK